MGFKIANVNYTQNCQHLFESPILWPPDAKNGLIGKDPDAGRDWRQEGKGMTEDETVGWHHWLSGHEFEQAPGDGDGQGGLTCCSPWGRKESDTTERLNKLTNFYYFVSNSPVSFLLDLREAIPWAGLYHHLSIERWAWIMTLWLLCSEKAVTPHSSTLAWRIPGTAEPGGLPSAGSHRVGHDWSDLAAAAAASLFCDASLLT